MLSICNKFLFIDPHQDLYNKFLYSLYEPVREADQVCQEGRAWKSEWDSPIGHVEYQWFGSQVRQVSASNFYGVREWLNLQHAH